ncbi:MFS transporter [Paenibacillus mesotrionivorans]|uniref:MFS transporter n=1 Tax=Paenibacillus mesotrionivorans TaxID=3160968 RepID=A0ACC7NXC2_9BACL
MNPRAVRAWMMYDWANSAFATTMMAAVLPIFYIEVASKGLSSSTSASYWGLTQAAGMLLVAILAPVLGAAADYAGKKMFFLRGFSYLGIAASFLFVFIGQGDYLAASLLFVLGTVGFSGGNSFYDALLPDLVPEEQKREYISSKGFAYGYVGGGLLLVVNLLMIQKPGLFGLPDGEAGTRLAFASVAVWWLLFSLPLFRHVKDRTADAPIPFRQYTRMGFSRTWETLKSLKQYPQLLKFFLAYWFFNDGINTIITMATAYGKAIGIGTSDLIMALLITQFVGIPFTLLFGKMGERLGAKPALYISLSIYLLIVLLGYFMTSATHFYLLAVMVGFVQGGSQAVARSLFSRLVPADRTAEFFGFLSVSGKFSSMVGPAVFAATGLITGSSRYGILALALFFLAGIALLRTVNLEQGTLEAKKAAAGSAAPSC